MVGGTRPRRGSMGFYPRKRAKSIVARIRRWRRIDDPKPLGFAGYKVGMLHLVMLEDNPNSPYYQKEMAKAATIIEVPPLVVCGIRAYKKTPYGLKTIGEIWAKEVLFSSVRKKIEDALKKARSKEEKRKVLAKLDYKIVFKDLERVFTLPKLDTKSESEKVDIEKLYSNLIEKFRQKASTANEIRLIVATQPRKAGIHKKKPEVFEIPVGGSTQEALEYSLNKLGKEIDVKEVFEEGKYVDVVSITKGKGFAGVVKRFGVKILPRWHKHRKGHRRIGSVGPTGPAIMFTTPRPGQLGFQQRTEYNKRILKIGTAPEDINPLSGFKHYGIIRSTFMIIEGSIPGPSKRLVRLRFPIRPITGMPENPPKILYMSTQPVSVPAR
ncbi:MAG: 50S ribosomal protein L3 [Thermoprotei archaeon]|nr:MAG: 50S ribosomal protein L3 [Thermoprotei archaeon]RLF03578.1 MAG: 50S ribosomal protein L3 [Thermoprotei archaeon]